MKKYILSLLVLTLLSSCAEWTMHQIESELKTTDLSITDARQFVYTMKASDYVKVSSLDANKALALSLDDDSTAYNALQLIGKNKCFTKEASADMYVPNFIANKYPQLSSGAQCMVTYNLWDGKSYASDLVYAGAAYTLTQADYKMIWNGKGAEYVNAQTEALLPEYLKQKFPTATEGKVMLLKYTYQDITPDTIYADLPYHCSVKDLLFLQETVEHELTGKIGTVKSTIYGRFYLVDGTDSVYVNGITDEDGNKVWKDKGIQTGDMITVKGRLNVDGTEPLFNDAVYVSHTPANKQPHRQPQQSTISNQQSTIKNVAYVLQNGEWVIYTNDQYTAVVTVPEEVYTSLGSANISDPATTINTYLKRTYPYATVDDEYFVIYVRFGLAGDVFTYDGTDWVMDDGYVDETMTFVLKAAWEADISTYLKEPFLGHGQGDFTIQNVLLTGALTYVWAYSSSYGMKASAYYNSYNPAESWLISPNIKLKKAKNPALIFDQASKYAADFSQECTVWVTTAFTGDVTTSEWKQLPWLKNADGTLNVPDGSSWTFQSSGEMPLTDYIDQTIVIGFRYISTETAAATWEIQNLLVHELEMDGEE